MTCIVKRSTWRGRDTVLRPYVKHAVYWGCCWCDGLMDGSTRHGSAQHAPPTKITTWNVNGIRSLAAATKGGLKGILEQMGDTGEAAGQQPLLCSTAAARAHGRTARHHNRWAHNYLLLLVTGRAARHPVPAGDKAEAAGAHARGGTRRGLVRRQRMAAPAPVRAAPWHRPCHACSATPVHHAMAVSGGRCAAGRAGTPSGAAASVASARAQAIRVWPPFAVRAACCRSPARQGCVDAAHLLRTLCQVRV
jgi:hypothetical protein